MNKKLEGYYRVNLAAPDNENMDLNSYRFIAAYSLIAYCHKNQTKIIKVVLGDCFCGTWNDPQPTKFPTEREPDNWFCEYYVWDIKDDKVCESLYCDEIEKLLETGFLKKIRRNSKLYMMCEL